MQVSKDWAVELQCEAFVAVTSADRSELDGLAASSKKRCIELTLLTMKLARKPAEAKLALIFLVVFLKGDPSLLAKTFLHERGPDVLVSCVKEDETKGYRDDALRAVLYIVNSPGDLRKVMDGRATKGRTGVAELCEEYPPGSTDAVRDLRKSFKAAFGRLPKW
jgi:hypothetical protein